MNSVKSATLWLLIFAVFIFVALNSLRSDPATELTLSDFINYAKDGRIISVVDRGATMEGEYINLKADAADTKENYRVKVSLGETEWITELLLAGLPDKNKEGKVIAISFKSDRRSQVFERLLLSVFIPIAIFVGLWIILMRQIQSGGAKAMSFGKSKAKLVSDGQIKITFDDVAGVDEAKEELEEIVEFLKDPKKFDRLGGKIPRGVLLYGRPGTGKTLLAKAVAGEASVPFFSISGSDFVEMFVGVGASRVRDLFEQGKRSKPCLIFIDEIDAVGRHRFTGIGGGHDEREQTLNQLLVEMDGFNTNEGVILIAATNRPDVLDPALLRPGRFDRQISVDFPDIVGREKILKVHAKNVKVSSDANLRVIAKGTPGFSGADLANIVNEAALLAARNGHDAVIQSDLEEAKDRVMMGPERRSMALSEKEKLVTAYHESGHALVATLTPDADPVHKVTIIPRGRSLGLTAALPEEDRHNHTEKQLKNQLVYMLGGRAAEKIKFNDYTTGASNDIQRATSLAHRMVCEFGMSEDLGPRMFGEPSGEVFLGKDMSRERNYSEETAATIDNAVKSLIDASYNHAVELLEGKRDILDLVAESLMERETLTGEELKLLIEGKDLPPLASDTEVEEESAPAPEPKSAEEKTSPASPIGKIAMDRPTEQPS